MEVSAFPFPQQGKCPVEVLLVSTGSWMGQQTRTFCAHVEVSLDFIDGEYVVVSI